MGTLPTTAPHPRLFLVRERLDPADAYRGDPSPPAGSATDSAAAAQVPQAAQVDAAQVDPAYLDAMEDLGDEITSLAEHIHAATHRLLRLIVEFDRKRGWELDGQRSCAHWLAHRTGIDLGAAREKLRAAHALESLPETSAAMARGELSFSAVRAITDRGCQTGIA